MNILVIKTLIFASLILEVFLADLSYLTHKFDVQNHLAEQSTFAEQGDSSDLAGLAEIVKDCEGETTAKDDFISYIECKNLLQHYSKSSSLLQLKDTLHIDLPPPFIA